MGNSTQPFASELREWGKYLLTLNLFIMKKIKFFSALATALLLLAITTGCDPDKKEPGDLSGLFEALEKPSEKTSFNAGTGLVFTSQSGKTTLSIPASSLVDESGNAVSGTVDLEFREIYSKGDMVRYRRPTQTIGGRGLESGGEVYLGLSQGGKALRLAPGSKVFARMDTNDPKFDMDVFYGAIDPTTGQFGWEDDGSVDTPNVVVSFDSANVENYGYEFFSDSLDWVNCDRFWDIPANLKTTVCANLPTGFNQENTTVFLVFTNRNSVMHLWNDGTNNSFCGGDVPLDDAVTFIAVSVQGEEGEEVYFLAHQAATVTAGLEVDLAPVETSMSDIEEFLGGF